MAGGKMTLLFKGKSKRVRGKFRKSRRLPFSKKQVKAIKKIAEHSSELKFKEDLNNNDASVTETAPTSHTLSSFSISQGTDNDERIGDKIKIKDLRYLLRVKPGSAGYDTTNGHIYRIRIIQFLSNDNPSSVSQLNPLEFNPPQEVADTTYKILYDRIFTLNPDDTNTKYHSIMIKGSRLQEIVFDDASTTVSQNNITFNVVPLTTTVDQLQTDLSVKIRYYDN